MKRLLLFIIIISTACSKENPSVSNLNEANPIINIDEHDFVSKEMATVIAKNFFKKPSSKNTLQMSTKVADNTLTKTVENITSLFADNSNIPAMYLINYQEGGFLILGATKNYYPILAYSDKGSLSQQEIERLNVGLSLWKDETAYAISKSHSLSDKSKSQMNMLWNSFETQDPESSGNTTASYTPEQYMKFYERMSQLYSLAPGYSFGPLSSANSFLSESEYNNYANTANLYGSPLECTIVGYKQTPVQEVGPLIGTEWHQGYGFNDLCPNQYPAGCVAIAMGQIMKFHQSPLSYNWTNMPSHSGTVDTQTLIYDLGLATNMNYGTDGSGTSIGEAKDAFLAMGYNTIQKDHNQADVKNEIFVLNRPVFMTGKRKTFLGVVSWKGHAWVCEGAREIDNTVNYFVEYQLSNGNYSSLGGPTYQSPRSSNGFSSLYFYLNWGWGMGTGNGWFVHNDVGSQLGSYEYNRRNLYINPNQ